MEAPCKTRSRIREENSVENSNRQTPGLLGWDCLLQMGWSSPSAPRHWITARLWSIFMSSNSYTATSDILLFLHPVARSGVSSTSTLDLDFFEAILVPRVRVLARELKERPRTWKLEREKDGGVWNWKWRRPGIKGVKNPRSYRMLK